MKYECGCELDPADDTERCDEHRDWWCHSVYEPTAPECPPCHRLRLLSVSLDPKATPTRRAS